MFNLFYFQSQLLEQTETINELQSRIQTSSLDHDRRLTSIQQTHEEEKQLFLGQLQESSNQIKDLERDLYFYKHKTRELRKSMATSTTTALDTSSSRRRESQANDDDLPGHLPTPRTAVQQQQQEPVWDGNKVEMISEKLAPDVYAFYDKNAEELNSKGGAAATSGGLIVGEKGSLLIETLLNKRLNAQILTSCFLSLKMAPIR